MITEFFINIWYKILDGLFSLVPEIEWTVDTTMWEFATDFLDMICYLLPWNTITFLLVLIFDLFILRIVLSFIFALTRLIPGY